MDTDVIFERRRKHRANIPNTHNGAYRKVYDKAVARRGFAAAIKAFCLECVMWEKTEVRRCSSPECPLWVYRPYK